MLAQGTFRDDLYFRLRVFPIAIPPLRQRQEDIPALVQHFIQKKSREMKLSVNPTLAPGALDCLMQYTWPGNARELENAIERELILSKGGALSFGSIGTQNQEEEIDRASALNQNHDEPMDLDLMMAAHIRKVLKMCNGRVEGDKGAARRLNIHPSTLRKRMKKLNIAFGRMAKQQWSNG
jgi:transcriptional regulator with PAS, ATPase and Fis domain